VVPLRFQSAASRAAMFDQLAPVGHIQFNGFDVNTPTSSMTRFQRPGWNRHIKSLIVDLGAMARRVWIRPEI